MVSLEEEDLLVFNYLSMHLKSGLIRGVVSLEEEDLLVFNYLCASDIWSNKRDNLW